MILSSSLNYRRKIISENGPWVINWKPWKWYVLVHVFIRDEELIKFLFFLPPAQQSCWGYIGFTPSIHLSVSPSVRPSHIPCQLCSTYSSGWIHFMFIHLIKQLQKVCCMDSFLQNFKIWIFGNFFLISNFDFVLFWLGIWCESLVWAIMGRWRVSQNAGVLVVLVYFHMIDISGFLTAFVRPLRSHWYLPGVAIDMLEWRLSCMDAISKNSVQII